jgi:ABC-2 type transport system permease protein
MTALLARAAVPAPGVTFPRVVRSERIKLTSLRSIPWIAGALVVGSVAFTGLIAVGFALVPAEGADSVTILTRTFGDRPALGVLAYVAVLAQILAATLGVLIVSSERASGLLATTVPAVPRRTPVLAAKLLVSGVAAFLVGLVTALASWAVVQPGLAVLGRTDWRMDTVAVQVIVGTALYLALISMLATALASLFRSTAAGLGLVLGVILLLPALLGMIPVIGPVAAQLMPSSIGMLLLRPFDQVGWAMVLTGLAALLAWVTAITAVAAVAWKRRDV